MYKKKKGYVYSVPRVGSQSSDHYKYKKNAYAVVDSNGHYFEFCKLSENSKAYKNLLSISEKYGKEIKEIETVRDLW